jgi:hypothetical protein
VDGNRKTWHERHHPQSLQRFSISVFQRFTSSSFLPLTFQEGEFDDRRAAVFGTPKEIELDLREGDLAAAEAVRQD